MIPMQGGVPMAGMAATGAGGLASAGGAMGFMDKFAMMDPMKKKLIASLMANVGNGIANPKGVPTAGGGLSPELLQMAMSGKPGGF